MNVDLLSLESYHYDLPADRIAKFPVTPRDAARLLVIDRVSGQLSDSTFRDLAELLTPGDLLVVNETKVIPARITFDKGEILLVREVENSCWDCMVFPGKHFKQGVHFSIGEMHAEVIRHSATGRVIRFKGDINSLLSEHGQVPLPPYIDRKPEESDRERYQTVYARYPGSVAAPTAGIHFTEDLLSRLKIRGVELCRITLHVGPGTFKPVKTADITQHKIDPEYYICTDTDWDKIRSGRRVIAVGTTTTRALETIVRTGEKTGFSELFIYPGVEFKIVQGLITNFHLPKSSLLMLVSAFAGYQLIRTAYRHAIDQGYRFYSYGDACLIL